MKRMVAAVMIAALLLFALVGEVCAEDAPDVRTDIKVYIPAADSIVNPESAMVCHNDDFYYIAFFTTTNPLFVNIAEVNPLEIHFISNGELYSLNCSPNISTGFRIEPSETVTVSFDTINFEGGFGKEIAKNVTNVRYDCSYTLYPDTPGNHSGHGPGVEYIPPRPEVKIMPYPRKVAFYEDFNIIARIKDEVGSCSIIPDLKFINCSNNSDIRRPFSPACEHPEGTNRYQYIWTISKTTMGEDERFREKDVCHEFEVNLTYDNGYYKINRTGPYPIHITKIPPPDIKAYLGEKEPFSEEHNNTIYLEEDTNLTFKAEITDYVEANVSLKLDVYKNNESYWNYTWPPRSIKGSPGAPSTEVYDKCNDNKCNIWFKKEKSNFTMNLTYNGLNETYNKTYKLNIIPLSIKFENVSVEPKVGYWDDKFNYSIWVTASIDLDVNLSIYDPCREPEPWIDLGYMFYTKEDVNRPRKLNWTNEEPFKKCCVGRSKFYFGYLGKETQVFFGPDLIKPPPEFDNGTTNPNVTIYCNWSNSSTPCNYSVNVTTEDEYKVRLLVTTHL